MTMRHTNFQEQLSEIRRDSISELKAALNANGCKVELNGEWPCLAKFFAGESGNLYEVKSLFLDSEGGIQVTALNLWTNEDEQPFFDDIETESIASLLDAIPETESVSDVASPKSVPVIFIDNDDLAVHGYPEQDSETLERIANAMADTLLDGAFFEAMDGACESLGIKMDREE